MNSFHNYQFNNWAQDNFVISLEENYEKICTYENFKTYLGVSDLSLLFLSFMSKMQAIRKMVTPNVINAVLKCIGICISIIGLMQVGKNITIYIYIKFIIEK